ncbi:MAG: hypothetical protein JWR37_3989, partial [Mycobacterium sp.]|nr:hypothetical protein [Mycobacterium sp.]
MVGSTVRITACAGVLAAGLLLGSASGGVAVAEPGGGANNSGNGGGDRSSSSPGDRFGQRGIRGGSDAGPRVRFGARATLSGSDVGPRLPFGGRAILGRSDVGPRGAVFGPHGIFGGWDGGQRGGPLFGPHRIRAVSEIGPRRTDGSGDGIRSQRASTWEPKRDGSGVGAGTTLRRLTIHLPVPQAPRSNPKGRFGYPAKSLFTTVAIEVQTVVKLFAIPQPEPSPGPQLRGREDQPVVDASGGNGGSEMDFTGDPQPSVLDAPMIIAPLPVAPPVPPVAVPPPPPIAAAPRVLGSQAAAGAPPPALQGAPPPAPQGAPPVP